MQPPHRKYARTYAPLEWGPPRVVVFCCYAPAALGLIFFVVCTIRVTDGETRL